MLDGLPHSSRRQAVVLADTTSASPDEERAHHMPKQPVVREGGVVAIIGMRHPVREVQRLPIDVASDLHAPRTPAGSFSAAASDSRSRVCKPGLRLEIGV